MSSSRNHAASVFSVRSSCELPALEPAQVGDVDRVLARVAVLRRERADDLGGEDGEPGLLQDLAHDCVARALAHLDEAAGEVPLAAYGSSFRLRSRYAPSRSIQPWTVGDGLLKWTKCPVGHAGRPASGGDGFGSSRSPAERAEAEVAQPGCCFHGVERLVRVEVDRAAQELSVPSAPRRARRGARAARRPGPRRRCGRSGSRDPRRPRRCARSRPPSGRRRRPRSPSGIGGCPCGRGRCRRARLRRCRTRSRGRRRRSAPRHRRA